MKYFQTVFLKEAEVFIAGLDTKIIKKVVYTIEMAEQKRNTGYCNAWIYKKV